MSLAVRTSVGQARYVTEEWDAVFRTTSLPSTTPLVWCHGNYGTAVGDYGNFYFSLRALAQRHTVIAADLGFNTFGNATGVTRVGQAIDYLASSWGTSGPAVLVGASMGGQVALNFAVRYPERVAAVVGIIPALSLSTQPGNPAADEIDLAFPPAYDAGNPDHLAHDATHFAPDLPAELPIHLWTSSDDPVCIPAFTDAFLAARPQTLHTSIGAQGHGGVDIAVPLAADWLRGLRHG